MKIKITTSLAVEERIRPDVGAIYDAEEVEDASPRAVGYFIKVNGERVGVFARECELVEEADS